uniref:3'-5' exonuclease domain-containing protein n=1 Tax=Glossina pallidipes TaxID=7398 RepID=A0A1A9Z6Z8_GLOPL
MEDLGVMPDAVITTRHCGDYKVLGFDCEWVSVGCSRKAVALLHLASSKGFCGLLHLRHMHLSLKNLLEDKEIIKVGIDPAADAQKLQEDYGIYVACTFDIRYLAVMIGCNPFNLFFTNVDFVRIKCEIKDLLRYPFIENFAQKKSVNLARGSLLSSYDTCRLQAPNGELLCGLSLSKAEWYLEEGLASKVLSKPLTVRLNKEPACKEFGYQAPHLYACAICYGRDTFVLKTIVPMEYRSYLKMLKENEFEKIKSCHDCKASRNYEMFSKVYSKDTRSIEEKRRNKSQ